MLLFVSICGYFKFILCILYTLYVGVNDRSCLWKFKWLRCIIFLVGQIIVKTSRKLMLLCRVLLLSFYSWKTKGMASANWLSVMISKLNSNIYHTMCNFVESIINYLILLNWCFCSKIWCLIKWQETSTGNKYGGLAPKKKPLISKVSSKI